MLKTKWAQGNPQDLSDLAIETHTRNALNAFNQHIEHCAHFATLWQAAQFRRSEGNMAFEQSQAMATISLAQARNHDRDGHALFRTAYDLDAQATRELRVYPELERLVKRMQKTGLHI